jgi:hypothetical protein
VASNARAVAAVDQDPAELNGIHVHVLATGTCSIVASGWVVEREGEGLVVGVCPFGDDAAIVIGFEVVPAECGQLELGAPGSGDGGSEGHRCRWFDLAVVDRLLDGGQRPAHFVLLQCSPIRLLASPELGLRDHLGRDPAPPHRPGPRHPNCLVLVADRPLPHTAAGQRACHRSTSTAVSRTSRTLAMGPVLIWPNRLFWFWAAETAHVGSFWSVHRSTSSPVVTFAASELRRTVRPAATPWLASRLVPRTVRLTGVGRPLGSRSVKARTSHATGERSRTVAMKFHNSGVGIKEGCEVESRPD